jgi:hypothetical protein
VPASAPKAKAKAAKKAPAPAKAAAAGKRKTQAEQLKDNLFADEVKVCWRGVHACGCPRG